MKTAISLPDDLFQAADELARELGVTRSELYATAVAEYLARRRDEHITELLDEVYRDQPSQFAPELRRMQGRSLAADKW
jgi:predicted transcriptional regulator